jgi:tetratricopeptide (TPR) repeat protein
MKKIVLVLISIVLSSFVLQSCAPTNPHLTEAKISMGRDDLQKARKELALVLEAQPNNVEAAYLEGYIHFKQENWAKMYDSFSKVKGLDPVYEKENIDNMSMKAFATLRSAGINDKFNKAVKLINAEVVEAEQAEKLFNAALTDLELADKFKSDDFITKDIIATIYLQLKNRDKAIEMFNQAISFAKQPDDNNNMISAYINLFNLYTEKAESEKAVEMMNKVLELDPQNKEALLQLAKHYEGKNEFDKAMPLYDKLVAIDPSNTDILFNQGVLFSKNKSTEKAIENFKKIIEINPNDEETIYFLTVFYNEKGMYKDIVELIEPKYEAFSADYKEKIKDYIQIALVKVGRAKDAKKYQ